MPALLRSWSQLLPGLLLPMKNLKFKVRVDSCLLCNLNVGLKKEIEPRCVCGSQGLRGPPT